jgi:DNA-binding winged helix-turn-helix (wHTH) protein/quercetin dioxygenase-like cupin family protein
LASHYRHEIAVNPACICAKIALNAAAQGETMSAGSVVAYRFGPFLLNLGRGCLQQAGIDLDLRPKSFEVLKYLVERSGNLASKDELVGSVWPDVFVSDDSLAQCIRDIRKLLDDDDQRFVRTVPRRGYMFVAEVTPLEKVPEEVSGDDGSEPAASFLRDRRRVAAAMLALVAVGLVVAGLAASTTAQNRQMEIVPIMAGTKTAIGQALVYPTGTPLVSAELVTVPPGETSPWHLHKVPSFVYVLEGEISVDYGESGVKTYSVGQTMLEATDWPHQAHNAGGVTTRLLVVFMGSEGVETRSGAISPSVGAEAHDATQ